MESEEPSVFLESIPVLSHGRRVHPLGIRVGGGFQATAVFRISVKVTAKNLNIRENKISSVQVCFCEFSV